jgi:hypothetical protein
MKSFLKRLVIPFAIFCFSFSNYSYGQIDKGTIAGTVKDAGGAAIPGAKVTVTRADTQQQRSLVTDSSGSYTAELLTAGTYVVSAEAPGFTKTELTAVQLAVYQVLRLDVELKIGSASQTVSLRPLTIPARVFSWR